MDFSSPSPDPVETDWLHALSHLGDDSSAWHRLWHWAGALDLFGKQPLLTRLLGKPPDFSNFPAVRGNLKLALVMIALIWILAAFGEELVCRGYLMNRVADLGRGTRTVRALLG
jgi:membrane protease YdiL (CAAX protease family)